MNLTTRTHPPELEEYTGEEDTQSLLEGETIDHPECGDYDILDVLMGFREGSDRERLNTLVADAIKKYDCFELVRAIELDLVACA